VTRAGAAPAGPATTTKSAKSTIKDNGLTAAMIGKPKLAKALRSGITIKLTGLKASTTVKLTATHSGKLVACGSAKATKNGTATVKLKFTTKAKRALRHAKSLTLKVSGAGTTTTVTLKRR
jgi:hypothetical protein